MVHLCEICGTPLRNLWYTSAKFVVHFCQKFVVHLCEICGTLPPKICSTLLRNLYHPSAKFVPHFQKNYNASLVFNFTLMREFKNHIQRTHSRNIFCFEVFVFRIRDLDVFIFFQNICVRP